jgi:F-type H+-transporting ATPase subunit epsilon
MVHLFIATLDKSVFNDEVISVTVPGTSGYFEVLKDHAPLIATLRVGQLEILDKDNKKSYWAVSGGVFEVSHNQATLLADSIEHSSKIDIKLAEENLKKYERKMEYHDAGDNLAFFKKEILKAHNRIKISTEHK